MSSPLLPEIFVRRMKEILGDEYIDFLNALADNPPVSIRYNPQKSTIADIEYHNPVLWNKHGVYLDERPAFIMDPLFHAGTYYVQEASSMFLQTILDEFLSDEKGQVFLDLCASPGGKSTILKDYLKDSDLLISNELIKTRVGALKENLFRWGGDNVIISNNDSRDFQPLMEDFDLIVVDAPCSGEGLFRKDKEAVKHWSIENIELCVSRQQRILSNVIDSLKEGGILIYSTCTYNYRENEDQVKWIMKNYNMQSCKVNINQDWGVTESINNQDEQSNYSYRFYPHKTKGEGFVISVLRKSGPVGSKTTTYYARGRMNLEELPKEMRIKVSEFVLKPEEYSFLQWRSNIYAIRKEHQSFTKNLIDILSVKSFGLYLGEWKANNLIPSHQLALSGKANSGIPRIELEKEDALSYLRGEAFSYNSEFKRGWNLVNYKKQVIGWAKVLDKRINNHYPKISRIRRR